VRRICASIKLYSTSMLIDRTAVDMVKYVRDLNMYIDADLDTRPTTVSRSFAALRQIRRSVPPATFLSLVVTLMLSNLDCGNTVLIALSSTIGAQCLNPSGLPSDPRTTSLTHSYATGICRFSDSLECV